MSDTKQVLSEIKDATYIISIPLKKFDDLKDLENFVKVMNENGIGVAIKAEYSNFYQGILVEVFNKEKCIVKHYIGV